MRFAAAQWCGMLEGGAWLRHAAHGNAMAQKTGGRTARRRGAVIGEPEVNGVFVELPPATYAALTTRAGISTNSSASTVTG